MKIEIVKRANSNLLLIILSGANITVKLPKDMIRIVNISVLEPIALSINNIEKLKANKAKPMNLDGLGLFCSHFSTVSVFDKYAFWDVLYKV